jgi:hypothetical protein
MLSLRKKSHQPTELAENLISMKLGWVTYLSIEKIRLKLPSVTIRAY